MCRKRFEDKPIATRQKGCVLNGDKNKRNPIDNYPGICDYRGLVGNQRLFFHHDEVLYGYPCRYHAGMSHNRS